MQNRLEILPTENGVHYKLPTRKTAKYKQAGLGLIVSALLSTFLFYAATKMLFGIGSGWFTDISLIFSLFLTGCWVFLGVKVFLNRTRQEIHLVENKLLFKELLFGKFGLTFQCQAQDIESLTIRSAADYISSFKRFVPDAKLIASNDDLKVIQANGAGGTELTFAQFYPSETISELTQDLVGRLAKLKSDPKKPDEIETTETPQGTRYLMPRRNTFNLRIVAILAMVPAAILWIVFVPGLLMLLGEGIASFLLCSIALSPLVIGATAVLTIGYRLITNQTRHEVLIAGDRLYSKELLIGKVTCYSSCKLGDIKNIHVKAFEAKCRELGVSRFLAPLFGSTYHVLVQTNQGRDIALAPAYKINTAQKLAQLLREKLLREQSNCDKQDQAQQNADRQQHVDRPDSKPAIIVGQPFGETASNQMV